MSDLPLASSAVEAPALAQLAARIHEAVREADLAGADPFAKVKGPKPKGWTHTHTQGTQTMQEQQRGTTDLFLPWTYETLIGDPSTKCV